MAKENTGAQSPKTEPQKVTVILPSDPLVRDSSGNVGEQQEFFSVNGKNILVKCDEPVDVPREFLEVIENKAKARREAAIFVKQNAFRNSEPPKG